MLGLDRQVQQIDSMSPEARWPRGKVVPRKGSRHEITSLVRRQLLASTDLRSCRSANVRGGSAFDDPLNMLREHRSFGVRQVTRRGQECD